MNKLRLGITDTHEHLAQFFVAVLGSRYDIDLINVDQDTPDVLLFGDNNFGKNNMKFSRDDCIKLLYTGENQRPEDYDCDYAISFDHNFEPWHYRLPLYVIYMWALEYIHNHPASLSVMLLAKSSMGHLQRFCGSLSVVLAAFLDYSSLS
jgi:hypothetical protein